MFDIKCPSCGRQLLVPEDDATSACQCPTCSAVFSTTEPEPASTLAPEKDFTHLQIIEEPLIRPEKIAADARIDRRWRRIKNAILIFLGAVCVSFVLAYIVLSLCGWNSIWLDSIFNTIVSNVVWFGLFALAIFVWSVLFRRPRMKVDIPFSMGPKRDHLEKKD